MTFETYTLMFQRLGFTTIELRYLLRHQSLGLSIYFNRNRYGTVYFTAYRKDWSAYSPAMWLFLLPMQKKDDDPKFITLLPIPSKEREAFQSLLSWRK